MNTNSLLAVVRWTGTALSILLVGFILHKAFISLENSAGKFEFHSLIWPTLLALFLGCVANGVLTTNYARIIQFIGQISGTRQFWSIWRIYGITQIYKYLPGNIFHFVGRQVTLSKLGLNQLTIGNATLIEIVSQIIVSGVLALFLGLETLKALKTVINSDLLNQMFLLGSLLTIVVVIIWLAYYFRSRKIPISPTPLGLILLLHLGYFVLYGLAFFTITLSLNLEQVGVIHACLIFSTAWIIGTLVPGASAGLGVREGVVYAMGIAMFGVDLSVAAILMRGVTVVADVLLWGILSWIEKIEGPRGEEHPG